MRWLLSVAFLCGQLSPEDWDARLRDARSSYSTEAIIRLVSELTEYSESREASDVDELLSEAHLINAELLRFEFEQIPVDARRERSLLGKRLDEAAAAGLAICEALPESSEKYRRRADLRGTLIRSKYRAKKHRKKMEADAARAVELDPNNARAYVSKAKLFLFADDRHGGDVEVALGLLHKALALDLSIESAHLLQAYAVDKLGRTEEAVNLYKSILENNPASRPASTALENISRQNF